LPAEERSEPHVPVQTPQTDPAIVIRSMDVNRSAAGLKQRGRPTFEFNRLTACYIEIQEGSECEDSITNFAASGKRSVCAVAGAEDPRHLAGARNASFKEKCSK